MSHVVGVRLHLSARGWVRRPGKKSDWIYRFMCDVDYFVEGECARAMYVVYYHYMGF